MDGLTLTASVVEMQSLVGGRIEKLQQPERSELLISIHTPGGGRRLLVSASSENCRIHITNEKRPSPVEAPNFLMLLRKHLTGARITGIDQPHRDRIVRIRLEARDELMDSACFTLVCEIMGRHSNVILLDGANTIVDAIRRVSAGMSSVRLVLPHLPYELPPAQDKFDPETLAPDSLIDAFASAERIDRALASTVSGLSPAVAALLADKLQNGAPLDPAALSLSVCNFYRRLFTGSFTPCIARLGEKTVLLPFAPEGAMVSSFGSIGEAADEFYRARAESESVKRRTSSLEKIISSAISRLERKADKFSLAIGEDDELERLRLYGELLTANMYSLPPRAKEAAVEDYYQDPPKKLIIPLDEQLSPSDNAQLYYKKYRKAKSAREVALVMRRETLDELNYLKSIEAALKNCVTDADLDEVRGELTAGGYVKENKKRTQKPQRAKPRRFVSSDGAEILVGKNNVQNDRLTFKESSPDDIWLHTKDIHGSHVILRCAGAEPSDTSLYEAALIAAFYSQAQTSSSVPVDYTRRRHVKKPGGAKPGAVIYTDQRTVFVTPSAETIERLRRE